MKLPECFTNARSSRSALGAPGGRGTLGYRHEWTRLLRFMDPSTRCMKHGKRYIFSLAARPSTRRIALAFNLTIKGGWGVTENGAIEEDLRPGRAQGKEHSWASRASQSAPGAKSTRITLWRTRLSPGSPCLLGLWSIPEDTCKLQWGIGPRRLPHLHLLLHSDTNGLFLEAIDVLYQNTTPRNSVAYRRRLIAEEDTHGPTDILAGHHENA
ncbi:hypothetical protein FRB93_000023 [Tulasnella sp. JGI-2019a]|nr:hypothetical protein FRB93_000023 [Tulasnella sp. JGI-2019a]